MRLSTRKGRRVLASSSPLGTSGRSLLAAAGGALALLAGTASAAPLGGTTLAPAAPALRDTILRQPARTLLVRSGTDVWGGTYTTATGETVRVFASDVYAPDVSFNQVRAEMIARLPHGSELRSLTAYFLTFGEMQSICGRQALACYSPRDQTIVTVGEDTPDGTSAESILAHEYGHHIARNRLNPPWLAIDWGTKRWASYVNVCARVRSGEMFPADPLRYELDPAEGFAEAYRVMAEQRAGKPALWLGIVSTIFQPDAGAAAALERDVLSPWTQNTTLARTGTVTATGAARRRTFRIATPLDGVLRVTVRPPAGGSLRLSVSVPGGAPLGRASAGVRTLQTRICGQRTIVVAVERIRGAGAFRLTVSRP
jgi:hypothetical protein